MPLERHTDDLTAHDGVKFWMSDGERPVLCRVSHEALLDLAVFAFPAPTKRFLRPLASLLNRSQAMVTTRVQALMTLASFSSLQRRSPAWAAAHEEEPIRGATSPLLASLVRR
jgi:hypothetical protein